MRALQKWQIKLDVRQKLLRSTAPAVNRYMVMRLHRAFVKYQNSETVVLIVVVV
jgi:hypothetical protein